MIGGGAAVIVPCMLTVIASGSDAIPTKAAAA
jgi:hypothetical protein